MNKLWSTLFIIFSGISTAFLGLLTAILTVGSGSGMAGGAIVFGYILSGLILGSIAAAFVVKKISPKQVKTSVLAMAALFLVAFAFYIYKVQSRKAMTKELKELQEQTKATPVPTAPVDSLGQ